MFAGPCNLSHFLRLCKFSYCENVRSRALQFNCLCPLSSFHFTLSLTQGRRVKQGLARVQNKAFFAFRMDTCRRVLTSEQAVRSDEQNPLSAQKRCCMFCSFLCLERGGTVSLSLSLSLSLSRKCFLSFPCVAVQLSLPTLFFPLYAISHARPPSEARPCSPSEQGPCSCSEWTPVVVF